METKNENIIKSELNKGQKLNKDSVKSKYILELIFSYLETKKKLDIIKYNNAYKKIFGLNLKKYKDISGKIKIGEKNGYNRIYNISSMYILFEGEYLNGKKNGFGKEYFELPTNYSDGGKTKSKLIFEGQFLNGIKNGKGKEYNSEGKTIFDGEYKNGKRWNGIVRHYYNNTIISFAYELLEGEIKGKVKEYYEDGQLKFEGEYIDGKKWNGFIYNKDDAQKYEIKNGNGKIIIHDNGILIFEGEYKNGIKYGKEYNSGGYLIFDGEYKNIEDISKEYTDYISRSSHRNEILKEQQWNGKIYIYHYYCDPKCRCFGTDDYAKDSDIEKYKNIKDLIKFEGEYTNDQKNGNGKEYNIEGNVLYEGAYLNDERKVKKKRYWLDYYADGSHYTLIFEGELLNGEKNGKAKEYNYSGVLIFESEYLNGVKIKEKYAIPKFMAEVINEESKGKFDKIAFESEYSKGKESKGKTKEYNKDNKLSSEKVKIEKEYDSEGKLL